MTQPPSPGWYADPQAPHTSVRWWDGSQWTEASRTISKDRYTADGEPLAGWWLRVSQYLIDSALASAAWLVLVTGYLAVSAHAWWPRLRDLLDRAGRTGRPPSQQELFDVVGPLVLVITLTSAAVFCAYVGISLRRKGRTPGMAAVSMRIRTIEPTDGPLPWSVIGRRLLVQQLGALVYLLLLPLGYRVVSIGGNLLVLWYLLDVLWPLWDSRNQTLHDKFAGTLLVRRA